MTPFKFILAATDFSVPANNAVRRAALLARQHGARLGIVHVVNPVRFVRVREWLAPSIDLGVKAAEARERLRKLAADLQRQHGVAAQFDVRTGDTFEELHRASTRTDLLVIGQRRRNPLLELVLGKTAQRLVETCRRPVLVVKQAADATYRRILVPIDFTPASDAAAVVAAALAPELDLQIFHAFDWCGEAVMREADVRESVIRECRATEEAGHVARMRRSMARLGLDSRRMSFALGRGSPVVATLRQAQAVSADLLVAAKRRRSRIGSTVLGSVNSLLLRGRCDMLIVPGRVRDPRQPQAFAQRLPLALADGAKSAHAGSARSARATTAASTLRAPAWTRAPMPPASSDVSMRVRARPMRWPSRARSSRRRQAPAAAVVEHVVQRPAGAAGHAPGPARSACRSGHAATSCSRCPARCCRCASAAASRPPAGRHRRPAPGAVWPAPASPGRAQSSCAGCPGRAAPCCGACVRRGPLPPWRGNHGSRIHTHRLRASPPRRTNRRRGRSASRARAPAPRRRLRPHPKPA